MLVNLCITHTRIHFYEYTRKQTHQFLAVGIKHNAWKDSLGLSLDNKGHLNEPAEVLCYHGQYFNKNYLYENVEDVIYYICIEQSTTSATETITTSLGL